MELENIMRSKELIWAQKDRSNWIIQGDRNTRYFETIVKQRRAQNRILQLRKIEGNFIEDLTKIKSMLVDHCRNQYKETDVKSINHLMEELATLTIPKVNQ